jgi:hypothetical protein
MGLLFFSESFPSPAQRNVRDAFRAAGGLLSRGWQDTVESLEWRLLRRAPRIAALLGIREPPPAPPEPPLPAGPPRRVKSAAELLLERQIDDAFGEYFRQLTVDGTPIRIRMPFALNDEREGGRGYTQVFREYGKGTPSVLWPFIEKVSLSKDFRKYIARLAEPGQKVVMFSLPKKSWSVTTDARLLSAMEHDNYPGTATRIFVHRSGQPVSETDVYNYLYAVAGVGVDCSGFVYHVLESVARARGVDLNRVLAKKLKVHPLEVRRRVGMWFYDPARGFTEPVADRIEDLRPLDMILFRGSDGRLTHSAVIQSVDLASGVIRYLQSTDWSLEEERGVHSSLVVFDPARTRQGLRHYSVRWLQQVRPPFDGEMEPRDWRTDGDRYLWYTEEGGSLVVRPRLLAEALLAEEPLFYTAVYPAPGEGGETATVSWSSARRLLSRYP